MAYLLPTEPCKPIFISFTNPAAPTVDDPVVLGRKTNRLYWVASRIHQCSREQLHVWVETLPESRVAPSSNLVRNDGRAVAVMVKCVGKQRSLVVLPQGEKVQLFPGSVVELPPFAHVTLVGEQCPLLLLPAELLFHGEASNKFISWYRIHQLQHNMAKVTNCAESQIAARGASKKRERDELAMERSTQSVGTEQRSRSGELFELDKDIDLLEHALINKESPAGVVAAKDVAIPSAYWLLSQSAGGFVPVCQIGPNIAAESQQVVFHHD